MSRIAAVPRLTTGDRLTALEERVDAHDKFAGALEKVGKDVQEIRELLLGAKAIVWFIGKVSAWVGGPGAIAGGAYWLWRTLH